MFFEMKPPSSWNERNLSCRSLRCYFVKSRNSYKFLPLGTDADLLKNSTPKEVLSQANEKSASSSFSSSANPESNNSSNGTGGYLDEEKDDIEAVSVVVENMDVDVKMAELSKPVKDVTDAIVPKPQSTEIIEEPPFKKFCLKPLNSLTTDQVNKDGSENAEYWNLKPGQAYFYLWWIIKVETEFFEYVFPEKLYIGMWSSH